MTISGERTEQLDIFCRVTDVNSDFLSFIDMELIRFFHAALQLCIFFAFFHLTDLTLDPFDVQDLVFSRAS